MKTPPVRIVRFLALDAIPAVAGLGTCLLSLLILLGWHLHLSQVTLTSPRYPVLSPTAAVGFLVAGLALYLARLPVISPRRQWSLVLAALAALIGGLTLLQYMLGSINGFDQWIARAATDTFPQRVSFHTGLCLFLIALAIPLLDWAPRRCPQPAQLLALIVANVALLALVGYIFRNNAFYALNRAHDAGTSLAGALLSLVLALGILGARPKAGFMAIVLSPSGPGVLARRLFLFPLLIPLLISFACDLAQRHGFLEKEFSGWARLVCYLVVFTLIIWWVASVVQRAEDDKGQEEHRFGAVAETAPQGILTIVADGQIVYANAAVERLFGYPTSEVLGRSLALLILECAVTESPSQVMKQLAAEKANSAEKMLLMTGVRRDGSRFPIELSVATWSSGPEDYLTAIVNDISERTNREREMLRLNNELIEANRELEAFSYSVSHDLRAPLRAIDGFSRILLEECAPVLEGEYKTYLHDIRQNAQQMGQLIDALLSFARLSRQPLKKHAVPMDELVKECLEYLDDDDRADKPQLILRELPACHADRSLMKQVWQNLIDNAIKYSKQRKPAVIEIGALPPQNGAGCAYFVRDNGAGFDMKYAGKLFGVFQRLHRMEEFPGTGVGLASVQRIIQRHGGRIWAEAQPDRGATFYFTVGDRS
jgi:PAS domain S-box-containing protein